MFRKHGGERDPPYVSTGGRSVFMRSPRLRQRPLRLLRAGDCRGGVTVEREQLLKVGHGELIVFSEAVAARPDAPGAPVIDRRDVNTLVSVELCRTGARVKPSEVRTSVMFHARQVGECPPGDAGMVRNQRARAGVRPSRNCREQGLGETCVRYTSPQNNRPRIPEGIRGPWLRGQDLYPRLPGGDVQPTLAWRANPAVAIRGSARHWHSSRPRTVRVFTRGAA